MQPALSREQWGKEYLCTPDHSVGVRTDGTLYIGTGAEEIADDSRHALAALALYQQDFGFTREDVEALNVAFSFLLGLVRGNGVERRVDRLSSLAARIEALLPPEEK